ncbi:FAD-binding oxidoreductase [Halorussus gelatinilyticus]|uniref:FAD-binding oxidoreductase n=1 Tax=Halorussus gelatinilyticus TaxID=2937524 RepID=A0A8U0IE09_9EURY|nr:FAD-dependent oxidoreductase [Halorussus gelatinilyticus]UPV99172.1 FAD-binding oxidoreductase [Halorussus gelatinilyticus]
MSGDERGTRVAVIGGGAVGVTAAYDLARRGEEVVVYEKDRIAGGSTGRAAGVLYDAYAAPEDARVGDRAMARFREFSGEADFEFRETPYVWFAHEGDERRADAIRDQVPRMREAGREVALTTPDELRERFPAVDWSDVGVAAVAENAGHTDPEGYARLLARKAEDAGAEIRTDTEVRLDADALAVERVEAEAGEDGGDSESFDAILVTAGAHTKRLLAVAGIPVPLKPYRVQALTAGFDADRRADLPMCYDTTSGYYLRPHPEGLLAGDGTEEVESDPDDWTREADREFCEVTRDRLGRRLGEFGAVREAWAGLCVATPDRDPLVGELRDGLFVAAGWQGHGFMRAPALGEAVAEAMAGENPLPEFAPTRFDGDEEFEVVEGMTVE